MHESAACASACGLRFQHQLFELWSALALQTNLYPHQVFDMTSAAQDSAPEAGPDLVIPLHYFDNSPMFTSITMYVIMVFDDVLDPEKLHTSLDQLVQRDTWRKLGARARKGVSPPRTMRSPPAHHVNLTQSRKTVLICTFRGSSLPIVQLLPIPTFPTT